MSKKFSEERLDRMASEYHRLHHRYANSRIGDERGERAYVKIWKMTEQLEATGQLGDFLARIR